MSERKRRISDAISLVRRCVRCCGLPPEDLAVVEESLSEIEALAIPPERSSIEQDIVNGVLAAASWFETDMTQKPEFQIYDGIPPEFIAEGYPGWFVMSKIATPWTISAGHVPGWNANSRASGRILPAGDAYVLVRQSSIRGSPENKKVAWLYCASPTEDKRDADISFAVVEIRDKAGCR